jgi:hypothetical protein
VGPWSRAFLEKFGSPTGVDTSEVRDLRIEPALITARVGDETVTLSAPPIPAGIWAAIEPVRADVQSESLIQILDHTWEEPLAPETIVRVGSREAVAAVSAAVAETIEADPSAFLRWRGYTTVDPAGSDNWRGGDLPGLPPPARRPPDSVPKRFGSSGIHAAHGDLVEALVAAYAEFSPRPRSARTEH